MSAGTSSPDLHDMITTARSYRIGHLLLGISPLLLAVLVYGYAVTLPFFLDDGPHFSILAQTDGLRHWGDFAPFPFYRPLTFTLWKLFEPVGYSAPVMHWLNVLCFGAAGVLVSSLTRRLAPAQIRQTAALFAGWFFVLFPFSYQAVAMIAALFHLTLTLGLLLCLWAALNWLDGRGGWPMLALCWLAGFVGVFSHENGVLLFPFLVGILFTIYHSRGPNRKRLVRVLLPALALVLTYTLLWLRFSPRDETTLTTDLTAGLAGLVQGLVYPLAAGLRPFMTDDIQPELLLALSGFVILALLARVWWHSPQAMIGSLYGLFWYIAAILPAALLLSAGYVLGQPRLALLASAGGGIFWGILLATLFYPRRHLMILAFLAFFGISGFFLHMRRADFLRLREWNAAAVALFEANAAAKTGAVLVNAPDYITPAEEDRMFLLGTEGVLWVDESLDYSQQFTMNSRTNYDNIAVYAVPAIQRSSGFGFRAHPPVIGDPASFEPFHTAGQVYLTQFDGRDFTPILVGGRALIDDPGDQALAAYGDDHAFDLLAVDTNLVAQTLTVYLTWQANIPHRVKTFVHVVCEGSLIAQSDGYPWGDLYPFAAWEPGEIQTDIRTIRLAADYPPGCLHLKVGLYPEDDVIRLWAFDTEDGQRLPEDALTIRLDR